MEQFGLVGNTASLQVILLRELRLGRSRLLLSGGIIGLGMSAEMGDLARCVFELSLALNVCRHNRALNLSSAFVTQLGSCRHSLVCGGLRFFVRFSGLIGWYGGGFDWCHHLVKAVVVFEIQ